MPARTLVVNSTHQDLANVVDFLDAFAQDQGWDDDLRDRVVLVGSEAVTNAMDHGNKFDADKEVIIHLDVSAERVVLSVQDEGEGFVRSQVADPLADENLLRDSGRGLFIIEELTDVVEYDLSGRKIMLTFKRR